MLFGCVTAAVTLVDGHGAQTGVEARYVDGCCEAHKSKSKKKKWTLDGPSCPVNAVLALDGYFRSTCRQKATCLHHGPPLRPLSPPGSRHNPTRPPSSLEPLKLEYPYPLPPFGNVVKRCRFSYLRISLPCEPNRKPKSHYAGCSVH
ncbi:hypothetical protein GE21DRAFT_1023505 [Neurospora crassa]|nr:hypothetical protein GE21DRAFT_1023505 [Neurospora crassa]